ncbi:MAG: hypothetical protein K6G11_08780, partial [Lachnospiraceae bacterium]|nr:hypothetical protein [Lachnospiraceae bacterium]
MSDENIHQFRFTLNTNNKADKELYDLLKKQQNMSSYIRQAVLSYHHREYVTKADLERVENRIIDELKGQFDKQYDNRPNKVPNKIPNNEEEWFNSDDKQVDKQDNKQ